MKKRNKSKSISATVLVACENADIDPAKELLKIAKKPNISLVLKTKIYQHLLKYLYPAQKDQDLLEQQERTAQLEGMKLVEKLTMEELKRLANQ